MLMREDAEPFPLLLLALLDGAMLCLFLMDAALDAAADAASDFRRLFASMLCALEPDSGPPVLIVLRRLDIATGEVRGVEREDVEATRLTERRRRGVGAVWLKSERALRSWSGLSAADEGTVVSESEPDSVQQRALSAPPMCVASRSASAQ